MILEKQMLVSERVHGDIRASTIFITEQGEAKFYDSNLIDYRRDAYVKTFLNISKCPLAPEQLKSIQRKEANPAYDRQSTEVWSIGILALTMATLSSEEVLYDWRRYTVDKKGLAHLLDKIQDKYSPLFFNMVKKCLDYDPEKRPNLPRIISYINQRKENM